MLTDEIRTVLSLREELGQRVIGQEEIRRIVRLKLTKLQQHFHEQHRAVLSYEEAVIDAIAQRCTEVDSGARNIDHILTHTLLPELAAEVLERMARQETFGGVHVGLGPGGGFVYAFTGSAA
jgi:type VI secretion system protein VasG